MNGLLFFCLLLAAVSAQAAGSWQIHSGDLWKNERGEWQTDTVWQNYDIKTPIRIESEYYWLKIPIPQLGEAEYDLFFSTRDHEVEAYLGGKEIYRYGNLLPKSDLLGSTWHMIDLPRSAGGREVLLRVYNNFPRNRLILSDLQVAPERELYARLIRNHIDYLLSAGIGVIMMLMMLTSWLLVRESIYLRTALFFSLLGLWAVGESPFSVFLWNDPPLWMYLILACTYAMPIVFGSMMQDYVEPSCRYWIKFCRLLLALYALAVAVGECFQPGMLRDALDYYLLLTLAGIVFWMTSLVLAMRQGNNEAHWLLRGLMILPILVAYDMAGLQWHLVPWHHHTTHLGGISLAFVLMAMFSRRIAERQKLQEVNRKLVERVKVVTRLAVTDPLTGLYNRSKFNQAMEQVCQSEGEETSLIFLDVDYFKRINDSFGHDVGDRVLIALSEVMLGIVGSRGIVARLGGEEFAVLCKGLNLAGAIELAEQLRIATVRRFAAEVSPVTCSFGVSRWQGGDTPERFAKRADEALYAAKEGGRNRVCAENVITLREKLG